MPATPPARRASTPSSPAATAGGRMGDEIRRGAAASSCNRSGDPAARRGHRGRRALGPAQPAAQAHGAGGVRGARDTPPGPTAPSTPPRRPPRGSQPREGGWRFGSMRAVRHPTARGPSPRPPACGWPRGRAPRPWCGRRRLAGENVGAIRVPAIFWDRRYGWELPKDIWAGIL